MVSGWGSSALPTRLGTLDGEVMLRRAVAADVPAIVALLADDQLGGARDSVPGRDDPSAAEDALAPYLRALEAVDADAAHLLVD